MKRLDKSGFMKLLSAAVIVMVCMLAITCDDNSDKDSAKQFLPLLLTGGTTRLLLYDAGTHNGNLKGSSPTARIGADKICKASLNKPDGAKNVHAFISISASDQISDMPANYGYPADFAVYGPNGTSLIVNNWADMLDSSINMSLDAAGVMPSEYWISGSNNLGVYYLNGSYNECNGFISNSDTDIYNTGESNQTDVNWIAAMGDYCNVATHHILCICEQ